MFPERFSNLPPYAFPRLRALLDAHAPGGDVLHMTIGEPKHAFPPWIAEILADHVAEFGRYPPNEGTPELRVAIADWLADATAVTRIPTRRSWRSTARAKGSTTPAWRSARRRRTACVRRC